MSNSNLDRWIAKRRPFVDRNNLPPIACRSDARRELRRLGRRLASTIRNPVADPIEQAQRQAALMIQRAAVVESVVLAMRGDAGLARRTGAKGSREWARHLARLARRERREAMRLVTEAQRRQRAGPFLGSGPS